jgi:hypothetical protein
MFNNIAKITTLSLFALCFIGQVFFSLFSAMIGDGCFNDNCKLMEVFWFGSIAVGMLISGVGLSNLFGFIDQNKWIYAFFVIFSPLLGIAAQLLILLFYSIVLNLY